MNRIDAVSAIRTLLPTDEIVRLDICIGDTWYTYDEDVEEFVEMETFDALIRDQDVEELDGTEEMVEQETTGELYYGLRD